MNSHLRKHKQTQKKLVNSFADRIMTTNSAKYNELLKVAGDSRVLLIFLRHFGCVFCRETMSRLARVKDEIEARDTKIVLVHMIPHDIADKLLDIYELDNVEHISDSDRKLYKHFGLEKATFNQMFNPKNIWRAFKNIIFRGHMSGRTAGDAYQMPGIFLLEKNKIIRQFDYKYVSDMPDFLKLTA